MLSRLDRIIEEVLYLVFSVEDELSAAVKGRLSLPIFCQSYRFRYALTCFTSPLFEFIFNLSHVPLVRFTEQIKRRPFFFFDRLLNLTKKMQKIFGDFLALIEKK